MEFALPSLAREAGFSLIHHKHVASTNDEAIKAALAGQDQLWIVADAQEAGRGRHGRDWVSPPGNLYASLALVAPCSPADAAMLGFVAGLALARVIHALLPAQVASFHLKWPNDGLMEGKKFAGILLEGAVDRTGEQVVALGFGVNIAHHPEGISQAATHLADYAPHLTPMAFFASLAAHVEQEIKAFAQGVGFAKILAEWQKFALPLNTPMRVRLPEGEQQGLYAGVNAQGHLQLQTPSGITSFLAGDVFLDQAAGFRRDLDRMT